MADPAFLLVAWVRVRGTRGARTAGVDGRTVYYVEAARGVEDFLAKLRAALVDRSFRPLLEPARTATGTAIREHRRVDARRRTSAPDRG